jgi:RNA-dependent RNA polymerase
VVDAFKEPPLHYSWPPPDIKEKYFERDKEDVVTFLARVARVAPLPVDDDVKKVHKLQEYLLGAVRDTSVVGKYSNFHGTATYTLGYTHPETIRLAYMYGNCRHSSFIICEFLLL